TGFLVSTGNEHGEWVARAARADRYLDVGQSGLRHQGLELLVAEAERLVAEPLAHPALVMRAQIQDDHAPGRADDADGFGERLRRTCGVVKRLRKQRDVHARVLQRQLLDLAALPFDNRGASPLELPRTRARAPFRRLAPS